MIGVVFTFGTDVVEVRIDGANLLFRNSNQGAHFAPLEGLQVSKAGVVKEFPELADDPEWKTKSLAKFKDKLAAMASDNERATYIIEDLKKYGYVPRFKQREGFRVEKLT